VPRDEREFYRRLGGVVRELRRSRHLTQDQLAERLGLQRTSVTNMEQGAQGVSAYSLVRLAEALGADPGEILDAAAHLPDHAVEEFLTRSVSDEPLQAWVRTITQSATQA